MCRDADGNQRQRCVWLVRIATPARGIPLPQSPVPPLPLSSLTPLVHLADIVSLYTPCELDIFACFVCISKFANAIQFSTVRLKGKWRGEHFKRSVSPFLSVVCQCEARFGIHYAQWGERRRWWWQKERERSRKGGRQTFFLLAFVLSFCIFCNLKRFPLSFGSSLFALPFCLHSSPLAHCHNDRPCLACGSTMG